MSQKILLFSAFLAALNILVVLIIFSCIYYSIYFVTGLNFYKTPLDLMYKEFIFPMMSRADWYALAGYTAVEVAAKQTCKLTWPCLVDLFNKMNCLCFGIHKEEME